MQGCTSDRILDIGLCQLSENLIISFVSLLPTASLSAYTIDQKLDKYYSNFSMSA